VVKPYLVVGVRLSPIVAATAMRLSSVTVILNVARLRATRIQRKQHCSCETLSRILIVDEAPATQHLASELELFGRLFERNGISAPIADPSE
jgi:hypothetical protein